MMTPEETQRVEADNSGMLDLRPLIVEAFMLAGMLRPGQRPSEDEYNLGIMAVKRTLNPRWIAHEIMILRGVK